MSAKTIAIMGFALVAPGQVSAADAVAGYTQQIKRHVEAHWQAPPGIGAVRCGVRIEQLGGGQIVDYELLGSCGSPAADAAVVQAVVEADPLPRPLDRDSFQRSVTFTFQPNQGGSASPAQGQGAD